MRRIGSAAVLLALVTACGGGGGEVALPPPVDPAPGSVRVSAPTPVDADCSGGRASGTVYVNAEVEPFVAQSPTDPGHLVAAWQQDRASDGGARALVSAVSFDGGRSWARTLQPMSRCGGALAGSNGDHERASDPWADIGADGSVYLLGLAFSGDILGAGSTSAMLVSRSTDGGRRWGESTSLQHDGADAFNDKGSLTADRTDARYVYAVWDRLDLDGNGPTLLARSADAGLSWEAARVIYAPTAAGGISQTVGNRIVVLTDGPERGTLVNVFTQIDTVAGVSAAQVRVIRSADKGTSWSAPVTVAEQRAVGTRDPDGNATIRDGAIIPTLATGAAGTLWVAWQDARSSGGLRDAIAVARSSDGGRSWSTPVAVNRDPAVPAFTPTLQVRADGSVALMHFDLRSNTPSADSLLADLWLLSSRDGATWTETALARGFDMDHAPSAIGGFFLGDYQGLVSSGSSLIALVALPNADAGNRTDVHAIRVDPAASALRQASQVRSRAATPEPGGLGPVQFAQARHQAIRRAMEARIPGWARITGAQ